MVGLDRLWAGWRSEYVAGVDAAGGASECVFCRILGSGLSDEETYIVHRDEHCLAILNLYPYTSGHLMVMPVRHVGELEDVSVEESVALWSMLADAVRALKAAYAPDGLNVGANIGRAGGAGIPTHFHMHAMPRWTGDTNFTTTVAETRVLPESMPVTWKKVREAWPS